MNSRVFIACVILVSFASCVKNDFYNKHGNNRDNFDLLWNIIDESYCYFDYKKVNWDSVYSVYSPQVSEEMSKYEFFDICEHMLRELQDGHVNLISDFNTISYSDFYLDYPQNYNKAIIERYYLGKEFINAKRIKAKNIRGVGYIHYESFMNLASSENIHEVVVQLGKIKGLIIDVRNNTGGYIAMVDTLMLNFSSIDNVYGYISYKEGKGHNDFSELYPQKLETKSSPVYEGNIVVLTNRNIFSAANFFVSAMSSLDNVTLIGDKTGGGGGAPITSELYNGWQVINSRNPLYNSNKQHIEFGIEPDIKFEMKPEDEIKGVDSMIEYAIDFLLNK
jgi:hypothetical protein